MEIQGRVREPVRKLCSNPGTRAWPLEVVRSGWILHIF